MTRFIVGHPWAVIIASLIPVVLLASQLPNIRFDTATEGFLHEDDPTLLEYNAFREQFGRDELIILALHPPRVFDLDFLDTLRRLHRRLEDELPHLDEVTSLINARAIRGAEGELIVEDLLEDWPEDEQDLRALERYVASNPSYRNLIVSEDLRFTTVVVRTSSYSDADQDVLNDLAAGFDEPEAGAADSSPRPFLTDEENSEVVAAVQAIVADFESPELPIHVAGSPMVSDELKRGMQTDMLRFIRLTFLAIAALLFILFQRISAVVLPIVVVALSLLSTIGLMAATGASLKLPTTILPSFLLAVGVGDSVHVLAIFFRRLAAGESKQDAIVAAVEHSGLPVILTSLTTAAGLLSFAPAALAPISDLGLFAPAGVLIALLLTLVLLPALVAVAPIRPPRAREVSKGAEGRTSLLDRVLAGFADIASDRPWSVIGVWALILLVAVIGALRVDFSHTPLEWLPASSSVRAATEQIDRELRGSITMEVVIDLEAENGWYDPEALKALESFSLAAEQYQNEEVFFGRAFSLVDVLKEINRALNENDPDHYQVPMDRELVAQEFLLFENSGSDDLEDLVDSQFRLARLTLKAPWVDAVAYTDTISELRTRLEDTFGENRVVITGLMALLFRTFTAVMISMVQSYSIALVVITLLMIVLIGSVRLGLVSMIPNLAPILVALGVMGWIGLPLDVFTLLIGSIALGLAVDDTIHFMHNYRRYMEEEDDSRRAIHETLATAGHAMLFTTLVLSTGFLVFTLASMNNVIRFGMLTGLAIAVALLADFLLAPALMQVIHDRGSRSTPRAGGKGTEAS